MAMGRLVLLPGLTLLTLSHVTLTLGCFHVEELFGASLRWMQTVSLTQRWYVDVNPWEQEKISFSSEGYSPKRKITLKCLSSGKDNTYLAEESSDNDFSDGSRCIKFQSLHSNVVRMMQSPLMAKGKELDCSNVAMTYEPALLFAHEIPPEPSPLSGGFELLLHQGVAVGPGCLAAEYRPSLHFQCGVSGDGGVRADFGRLCEPEGLRGSQALRGRHDAQLWVVGSWRERGHNKLLMRMENAPLTTWCLAWREHDKKQKEETGQFDGYPENDLHNDYEGYFQIYLTLSSQCEADTFGGEKDLTSESSLFGFMARYFSEDDPKCSDESYLQGCRRNRDSCHFSSRCPSHCGRCVKKDQRNNRYCYFDSETRGDFRIIGSSQDFSVSVSKSHINGSAFGEFECRDFPEQGVPGTVYPVVQSGVTDNGTCAPYFACAQVTTLTTGVMAFNLRSAVRHEPSGKPMTCFETHSLVGNIYPVYLQKTVTLVDEDRLYPSRCSMPKSTYPTIQENNKCRMTVDECSGNCTTFTVGYDPETCSIQSYSIEKQYVCLARLMFRDGVVGILANATDSGRKLCWIFNNTKSLLIASSEMCNQDRIDELAREAKFSPYKYDPFSAVLRPVAGSDVEYGAVKDTNGAVRIGGNEGTLFVWTSLMVLTMFVKV